MKIYEGQYDKAADYLDKAFSLCHSKFSNNKLKILRLLIPLKMLCGLMPSDETIKSYNMNDYQGIVEAVKNGDLKAFELTKKKYRASWIKRGVYFLFDQIELILIRRLIKFVWILNKKQSIVPTEYF